MSEHLLVGLGQGEARIPLTAQWSREEVVSVVNTAAEREGDQQDIDHNESLHECSPRGKCPDVQLLSGYFEGAPLRMTASNKQQQTPAVPVLGFVLVRASRGNIPGTEMGCSQDGHKPTGTGQGTQPSFRRSLGQEWRVIGAQQPGLQEGPRYGAQ